MSNEIRVSYLGQLRCKAVRGDAGPAVQTDVDAAHGGQGQQLSPIELTVAALGTCVVSMMGVLAERNGVDFSGVQVTAGYDMVSTPHRRIGSVHLKIQVPAGVPENLRPKLEAAAHCCPVKSSLHPDIRVEMEFAYETLVPNARRDDGAISRG